ncbi:glutamate racemase [Mergibacter septicus]|uniref:glutamate racemase n=1 Tax=Mergibacter septicus TaxID=221402 RepID=UPI001178FBB4|nr:glutamate racemase [Mergibacter septicus]AWX13964.1 glutamate racemase [Mergibacter septicus]
MTPTILIFDSGMGGLSVYHEIRQQLPEAHYIYCFDNAFFPYSEKQEACLIERALFICEKVCSNYQIDIIVVACNTASTVVLPALRNKFSCAIVGTVPAIKPAAKISETKVIGLLATKGTIKRAYVDQLIQQYAQDCEIKRLGSTRLVEIAEQKLYGNMVEMRQVESSVAEWQNEIELDTVILGCTHFPLLKQELQFCLPQVKFFLDSGTAIAKRVKSLLNINEIKDSALKTNLMLATKALDHQDRFIFLMRIWGFERFMILH